MSSVFCRLQLMSTILTDTSFDPAPIILPLNPWKQCATANIGHATRYSLLATSTRYSLLAIRYSLFATANRSYRIRIARTNRYFQQNTTRDQH